MDVFTVSLTRVILVVHAILAFHRSAPFTNHLHRISFFSRLFNFYEACILRLVHGPVSLVSFVVRQEFFQHSSQKDDPKWNEQGPWILNCNVGRTDSQDKLHDPEDVAQLLELNQERNWEEVKQIVARRPDFVGWRDRILLLEL